jgi:hypothetical protein
MLTSWELEFVAAWHMARLLAGRKHKLQLCLFVSFFPSFPLALPSLFWFWNQAHPGELTKQQTLPPFPVSRPQSVAACPALGSQASLALLGALFWFSLVPLWWLGPSLGPHPDALLHASFPFLLSLAALFKGPYLQPSADKCIQRVFWFIMPIWSQKAADCDSPSSVFGRVAVSVRSQTTEARSRLQSSRNWSKSAAAPCAALHCS